MTARALLLVVVFALGLVVVPAASAAANPLLLGSTPVDPNLSGATSVAISGHYAYTTAYAAGELTAVDISNPSHPVVAGSSPSATYLMNASTVNIAGGFAYVASKNRNGPCLPGPVPMCASGTNDDGTGNSLTVLNISTNPAQPQIVGHVSDPTKLFGAYGVAVSGTHAYVAAQGCLPAPQPCPNSVGDSFEVVDLSNPASPTIVGSLRNSALPAPFAGSNALAHVCSVAISGHYAYVTAANSNRLTIIDIANPTSPAIVSSLQDNTQLIFPVDVAVKGNYAYVADQGGARGFTVVDVTDPVNPHVTATVTDLATLNGAYRIRVNGNFAYISASSVATVTAIDISNPLSPQEAGHLTDTTHLNKTTGLDVDPTGTYVVASSPYDTTQSNHVFPPFPPLTGTVSVLLLHPQAPILTAVPSISGTAKQGNLLTASPGAWLGAPAPTFGYQWSDCDAAGSNCKAISGATSTAYTATANDVGSRLEFAVRATNVVGSSLAQASPTSVVAGLPGPPPPPPTAKPVITGLRQSARTWRTGGKLAHISAAGNHAKKRPPVGTSFSFTLNLPAGLTLAFTKQSSGRQLKGQCRRETAQNHRRPHCKLSVPAGQLVFVAHKGINRVSFAGRLSHTRKLGPGHYTLTLTAIAAGKRSDARTIGFTIVR